MNYGETLVDWFLKNKREMPWREKRDAYSIWVSEVMLQQTQVDTVIPYYNKFIKRFPTVEDLANADVDEVYGYWQGLGYYRRAMNLHKGAKKVVEEYGGKFPIDPKLAKEIPSIGPYTLGAVLSIAYNMPLPAVDGNVMRVLSRQFLIDADIGVAKNRKIFEEKVMELMPDNANAFNQGLMELGATICTPKSPKCEKCPMQTMCKGYDEGAYLHYPVKKKKVKVIPHEYIALIIQKDDAYWMYKRKDEGLLDNLWALPLIDQEVLEQHLERKNIKKELKTINHIFTHKKWIMTPIVVCYSDINTKLWQEIQKEDSNFISKDEMKNIPIGTAFKKILEQL